MQYEVVVVLTKHF